MKQCNQYVLLFLQIILFLTSGCKQELLVECELFEDQGGWVVDPQFVEQMGSPYLMAHGLGQPVGNAKTTVYIPSGGSYHIWARTMDWAPDSWKAPGRFNIRLDGRQLPKTLGNYKGWGWNYAGKVKVKSGHVLSSDEKTTP